MGVGSKFTLLSCVGDAPISSSFPSHLGILFASKEGFFLSPRLSLEKHLPQQLRQSLSEDEA